jgi:hypothetical protein
MQVSDIIYMGARLKDAKDPHGTSSRRVPFFWKGVGRDSPTNVSLPAAVKQDGVKEGQELEREFEIRTIPGGQNLGRVYLFRGLLYYTFLVTLFFMLFFMLSFSHYSCSNRLHFLLHLTAFNQLRLIKNFDSVLL